jgi:hypothetical protein
MLPMALPVEPPGAEAIGTEYNRPTTAEDLKRAKDKQARAAAAFRVETAGRKEDHGEVRITRRKGNDAVDTETSQKTNVKLEPEEDRDDLAWTRRKAN